MKLRNFAPFALPLLLVFGCITPKTVAKVPRKPAKVAIQAPAPDIVKVDLSTDYKLVTAEKQNELLVRVRVNVGDAPHSMRPPVNIALALDTSSSMRGAMADARAAVKALVEVMEDGDRIAIVTFGSEAKLLVPSTELSAAERPRILKRIDAMEPHGSTAMAAGVQLALQSLDQHRSANSINRLVLVGDGVPNDPAPLVQLAKQVQSHNATVTALGLGLDYDETVMAQIAQYSGGRFQFVEQPEQVAQLMRDEVLHINQVVARNARLSFALGPGVRMREVVGLPAQQQSSRQWSVMLGDLSENTPRDVVLRLTVPARHDGSTVELLDARLDYQDNVVGAGAQKQIGFIEVGASRDAKAIAASLDVGVRRTTTRVRVAANIIAATAAARSGQLKKALRLLDIAEQQARRALSNDDDKALKKVLLQVATLRKTLPSLAASATAAMVPQTPLRPNDGPVRPGLPAPASPPMAPAQASAMRQVHAEAMKTIQGSR